MEQGDLRAKAYHGVKWAAVATYSSRLVRLAVLFVLMWLIDQREFGLLAIASVVLVITQNLSELGIGQALIWHRSKDPKGDLSLIMDTGLVMVMTINLTVMAAMMAAAPWVASFFNEPRATAVTRVLLIGLAISTLTIVPRSILERDLRFRAAVWPEVLPGIVSGLVSIPMALIWRNVWSLVAGQMVSYTLRLVMYWAAAKWRPRLRFDWLACKEMLAFGLPVLGAAMIGSLAGIIPDAVVGRGVGTEALGVYDNTEKIATFPFFAVVYVVGRVMFPLYTRLRDRPADFRVAVSESIKLISAASMPMCIGVAAVYPALELTLFHGKWFEMYVPLAIMMVFVLQRALGSVTGDVLKAVGRPNLIQVLFLIRVVTMIPLCIAGVWLAGLNGAVLGLLLSSSIALFAELRFQRRYVNLSAGDIADCIKVPLVAGCFCASVASVVLSKHVLGPTLPGLIVGVALGALTYVGLLLRFERSMLRSIHQSIFGRAAAVETAPAP